MDYSQATIALTPFEVPSTTPTGQRILDVASRLFYDRGIGATGVDLISLEAETTKRTLYQRFGSKENLIAQYLVRRARRWQLDVLARIEDLPPEAALDALYDLAQTWSAGGRGCAFVNAWSEVGSASEAVGDVVRAEKAWMRSLFDRLGGSTDAGAVLHLLYEGAQVNASIQCSDAPWNDARVASTARLTGSGCSGRSV